MEEVVLYLRALLIVSLEGMKPAPERRRPELLLDSAGFKRKEIAAMLQKSEAGVTKTLQRAKKATGQERQGDDE